MVNPWFSIMSSCGNCTQSFIVNNDCIACDMCDSWFHFCCTNLNPIEFLTHCNDSTLSWTCSTCDINTHCAKCKIEFIPSSLQKSICCDYCDKYFHLKCTVLTVSTFQNFSNSNEHWYCRSCKSTIFPFHTIDNKKLINCMDIKVCKPQILNIPKTEHINCSCCSKKIKQNQRHISCSRCIHYIHKKCTFIKAKDFEKN